ncbi:hypothetical protein IP76_16975 [Rhizobium sp. AAP43]|nr:hypothetical protein IP76_16975 [Rhizobium sp. AAP43]
MAGFAPNAAHAQARAVAGATETVSFQIPAQPLSAAINAFIRQSGWQISYSSALAAGKTSTAVSGSLTPSAALQLMVQGTGVTVRISGPGSAALVNPHAADAGGAAADGSTVLETITVQGQGGGTTEGSGSYTTGQMNTATGLPLSIRETPQSVTVVTRQRMEDQASSSLQDVLETSSGISIQKYDSDRTEYLARGFTVGEFQYDGVVIQNEGVYDYGLTNPDTAIYDRVEIVKGANGLLQGSGSPGAAVNLVRKRPTDTFQASITGTAGSGNAYRTEADVSGPLNPDGSLRGRLVGSFEDAESYLDHYEKKSFNLYGILEADITDNTTLSLGADYQQNRPRGSSWTGLPMFYSDGTRTDFDVSTNPATDWSRRDTFTNNFFVTLDHEFDNGWKTDLTYNHRRNGHDSVLGSAGSGYPDPVTGAGVYQYVGKYTGRLVQDTLDAKLSGPIELFGREHDLMFGATASHKTTKGPLYGYGGVNYDPAVPDFFSWDGNTDESDFDLTGRYENSLTQYGAYAATRLRPTDDLSFILGSRFSWYDYDDQGSYDNATATWSGASQISANGKVTPYLGVVYDVNQDWSVYASYTGIFKPQGIQDVNGAYLDPEEGHSYEAGVKAELFGGRLNTSAAVFMIKQDNVAERAGTDPNTGEDYYTAADGVTTKGFELEASGEIRSDWNVYASYTYSHARKADGERVYSFIQTTAPENVVKLYTTYTLPGEWDKLTIGGGVRWQDKIYGYVYSPANVYEDITQKNVFLVDLMAKYKLNDKVDITFNVKNLLNEKYYAGLGNFDTGYYGEPRSFSVSTKFKF